MKTIIFNSYQSSASPHRMVLAAAVLAVMPLCAAPTAAEPKPATVADAAAIPAIDPAPAIATPSRLVGKEQLAAHVQAIAAVFTIARRATDPFGLPQDPNAKPVIKPSVAKASRSVPSIQATPFSEIVRLIKVTTIMPNERRFLIGTRSIRQGDRIPLGFRGRNINVEVVSVSSRKIEFRNLDSGETAAMPLNLLPVGMTPGTNGITAPGMLPDRPNSPINLDSSASSMDDPRNANSTIR
jgi:hypothetical protein